MNIELGWAAKVTHKKQWLLHTPTLAIGPVEKMYDGVESIYKDPSGGEVHAVVLQLLTGHSLIANPNAFVELSEEDVAYYRLAAQKFSEFSIGAVGKGAELGVQPRMAVTLLISILRGQLHALETIDTTEAR